MNTLQPRQKIRKPKPAPKPSGPEVLTPVQENVHVVQGFVDGLVSVNYCAVEFSLEWVHGSAGQTARFQARSKDQEILEREVELDPQVSPEEITSREVELG